MPKEREPQACPPSSRSAAARQSHACFTWLALGLLMVNSLTRAGENPAASAFSRVSQVRAVPAEEAAKGTPVKLRGIISFMDRDRGMYYLQEGTESILVRSASPDVLGDFYPGIGHLVEVEGITYRFRNQNALRGRSFRIVEFAAPPEALDLTSDSLFQRSMDGRFVRVRGWFTKVSLSGRSIVAELLLAPGRIVETQVIAEDFSEAKHWPGCFAEVTGVLTLQSDASGRINSARVYAIAESGVRATERLNLSQIIDVREVGKSGTMDHPVRFRAQVVSHSLGDSLTVQDKTGVLRIPFQGLTFFNPGSTVQVLGWPVRSGRDIAITNLVLNTVLADATADEPVATLITPAGPNTNLPVRTQISQIRSLSAEEASRGYPVKVRGVATYVDPQVWLQFIQDDSGGVYVDAAKLGTNVPFAAGQLVELTGYTGPGNFAPFVVALTAKAMGPAPMPTPSPVTYRTLMTGVFDSTWVHLKGVARAQLNDPRLVSFTLYTGDGALKINVPKPPPGQTLPDLINAGLEVSGVAATLASEQRHIQRVEIMVPDWTNITITAEPPKDPFALPVKNISELFQFHAGTSGLHRSRFMGVITLRLPDGSFYLQDSTGGLLLQSPSETGTVREGDTVDVSGFPVLTDAEPLLQDAVVHPVQKEISLQPLEIKPDTVLDEAPNAILAKIEGQVLGQFSHRSRESFTVSFGQRFVEVSLEHGLNEQSLPKLVPGTIASFTGVYLVLDQDATRSQSFRLLLRSPRDVTIVAVPGWWTSRHTLGVLGATAGILLLSLGWVRALRRKVRNSTRELQAEIEMHTRTEKRLEAEIADRKRAEAALLEKDRATSTLLSNLPGMAYRCRNDENWTMEFLSEGCAELIGYPSSDLVGNARLSYADVIHPDDRERVWEETERSIQARERYRLLYRIITAHGAQKWVWEQGLAVFDAQGSLRWLEGLIIDITDRKLAEQRLAALSSLGQRLNTAKDARAAAQIVVEVADELLGWDSCACELYRSEDDLLSPLLQYDLIGGERQECPMPPEPFKPSEILRRTLANGAQLVLRSNQEQHNDLRRFGDVSRLSASLMFAPIRNGQDTVGVLSIQSYEPYAYNDQSLNTLQTLADACGGALERITANQALLDSERFVRALVESLPQNIIRKDLEGRLTFANQFFCQTIGRPMDQILGMTDFDLYPTDLARKFRADDQEVIASGKLFTTVEENRSPSGEVSYVEVIKTPVLDAENNPIGLQVVFWDVTERKRAESKLEALHKELLEASRQAGMAEVATSVLHNVGNVLNSVNVSTTLLTEKLEQSKIPSFTRAVSLLREHEADLPRFLTEDPKGKALPAFLDQLEKRLTGERSSLMAELAGLSRNIDHIKNIIIMQQSYAKVSGVTERAEAAELVEDALRFNAGALDRHHVSVTREFAPGIPPILVDKHKVLQILVNLIRNAKYACDQSGRTDKHLCVRVANGEGRVKISVADNGVGIAAENLTRIFNLGFTTRKDGHGFGLHSGAIAAKEIGGALSVQSDGPGKGATFTLELPLNPKVGL